MKIQISCSSTGIGDHVSAVYTACGYASAGHEVEFTTPYNKWLERVKHPNLSITGEKPCPFSVYDRYPEELVAAQKGSCKSRPEWYALNVADYYDIPYAEPVAPETILPPTKTNHCNKPYILIAPFAAGPTRSWDEDQWQFLAEDLLAKGYDVIAVCSAKEVYAASKMFSWLKDVKIIPGAPPQDVLSLVHYAHRVVGNDSSIAHLAALHRKYVTVICAHVKPEFVFGPGNRYCNTVHPDTGYYPCTWCCWTADGGFRHSCWDRCDALQSIEYDKVLTTLQVV